MTIFGVLKDGFRSVFPSCRQVARLQSDRLDQELGLSQRVGLRFHLLVCSWCRRYGKQLRFLQRAVHEHPDEWAAAQSPSLSPEARQRIKRALRAEPE